MPSVLLRFFCILTIDAQLALMTWFDFIWPMSASDAPDIQLKCAHWSFDNALSCGSSTIPAVKRNIPG